VRRLREPKFRRGTLRERFLAKFEQGNLVECWPWLGVKDGKGYGEIWDGSKMLKAHRVSWSIFTGSEPRGIIHHKCGNPACVNPAHMKDVSKHDHKAFHAERRRLGLQP